MPDTDPVFDQLALLAGVVGTDADLRRWFVSLSAKSAGARVVAIQNIVRDMVSRREPERVVVAFSLLEDPRIYQAVRQTLVDRGYLDAEET